MAEFFTAGLDYRLFFYGIVFLCLAGVAYALHRRREPALPWTWLAGFAAFAGLRQWLSMPEGGTFDSAALAIARLALEAVSLVALVEFGRRGYRHGGRPRLGYGAYLPVLAVAALGVFSGEIAGVSATCWYALGLPGGVLAALAAKQAAQAKEQRHPVSLKLTAGALLVLAASSLMPPSAPFPPAAWLNEEMLRAATGVSVQLIRALCAMVAATGLWLHNAHSDALRIGPSRSRCWLLPTALSVALAIGWVCADWHGRNVSRLGRPAFVEVAEAGETIAEIGPADRGEVDGKAWDKLASERRRAGMPVVVFTLLGMAVLVAVCMLLA